VLDLFAGTGALGLEALSRGAGHAVFVERDRAALVALRANVAACRAADRCSVLPGDVLAIGPGEAAGIVFLDPPYGQNLVAQALARSRATGRLRSGTLIVAEVAREDALVTATPLHERVHGAARIAVWREP
jgi:16S rRNA (guanine966-N2)-methyltransferase